MLVIPARVLAVGPKVKIVVSEIAHNHGHAFTMNLDELTKAGEMNYSIQGSAGHPHFIRVTPDMLTKLSQNQVVTFISSTDAGHSHQVTMKVTES